MPQKKNLKVLLISSGVVVALLAGAGVTWLVLDGRVKSLERQVAELEGSSESSEAVETSGTTGETSTTPSGSDTPAQQATTDPVREEPSGPTEVQPGYVQGVVNEGGTWKLTVDYVQFLTGGEAAEAATARGDESPPPNDYYIINDNPKLREFPIQAGIGVIVVTNSDGTSDPAGHSLSLSQWASALNGPHAPVFRSSIYWVTVTNGTVTAINAQYTP